ncbi:unknown [Clostridium sp. CAG:306]|nr:unknown [Clostridium sp. CAG:306]
MNPERLQLKGMLAESKKRYRCIDTESSGLILLLRSLLNPYEEIINIDTEKIVVTSIRLKALQDEMKTLSSKIKNLEAELE